MKISKKVKYFAWYVIHGRVNTLDRMVRKFPTLVGHSL